MIEAENLLKAGVRELLVVSQDTSAYGVDVRYRTGFWRGRPLKTRMTELAAALAALAAEYGAWVRLHYVYPYPHVDEIIAADGQRRRPRSAAVSRRAVPAREPAHPQADEAPGERRKQSAADPGLARRVPGADDTLDVHRRISRRNRRRIRGAARIPERGRARPGRLLRLFAGRRRGRQRAARSGSGRAARRAPRAVHGNAGSDQRPPAASGGSARR